MADADARREVSLLARLTRLAVPVALGRFGGVVMGITDTVVVGQFAPGELAALGLGWTLNGPALMGGHRWGRGRRRGGEILPESMEWGHHGIRLTQ